GTSVAQEILGLYPGEPYDRSDLEEGLTRIETWYHGQGHHQVSVSLRCQSIDDEFTQGLCDPLDVRAALVELSVEIDEGQQTQVGEVLWRGNFKTRPSVLVRDMPREGQPYNPTEVTEAARRLRNLGVFNAVQIDRIGLDEDPPRESLGLVVSVEEAESRFIDMAVGFRTIDREVDKNKKAPPWLGSVLGQETAAADRTTTGFGRPFALSLPDILLKLEAEYVDMNFLGMAHRFRVPFRFGFSTNDPLRVLSLTPTFSVPRLLDTSVHMDLKVLAELDEVTEQLDRTELGVSGSFTWPVAPRMTLGASLDAGFIRFRDPEFTVALESSEDLITGELTPQVRPFLRWRWDTQDNPLNPTRGFALATQLGYILEIDRDTIATRQTASLNDFVKWEASAEGAYQTRIGPVLAAFIRYGGSIGDGETLLPPNERFTLGGTTGMRGFADHSVGRYDEQGKLLADLTDIEQFGGGNVVINGSLEIRMPLMRQAGVWAGLFMDGGVLARSHAELHPSGVRASAGIGLRYLIGQQIPLRLDWGYIVGKPRCLEWRADDPGGTCGTQEESSAFHLDLLYPF
ncbi:MAG: BamA/TamA family outer membrane protein, partial [Myxococcota bacterium]|nr:BamA/TamA family outer membrane protein [Myxococcota bacterium]